MLQPRRFEGGACRRIQTKGQKTEFVRIGLAVRDRQNGKECASDAMKGRYTKRWSWTHRSAQGKKSKQQNVVVLEDHECGFECECEGAMAERGGALNERQESSMLYQYFETRVGVGIENKAGWEIEVKRDVALGTGLRGDSSAGEENETKRKQAEEINREDIWRTLLCARSGSIVRISPDNEDPASFPPPTTTPRSNEPANASKKRAKMATGGTDNSKHTGAHQLFIDRVPGRQLIDFTLIFILCAPHLRLVTTVSIFGSAGHASRFLTIQTPHQHVGYRNTRSNSSSRP
ncbi:hypothetical protein B0H13DRAFT_1889483 [Mycena leptocephala]|nr:hypothetical protein B0H13DRAFT_1889483 [Mycena leptocephala]